MCAEVVDLSATVFFMSAHLKKECFCREGKDLFLALFFVFGGGGEGADVSYFFWVQLDV